MVATLVKLKWRLTLNALTKNVWAIVGTVIGALYGIGALVMVLAGAVGLGLRPPLMSSGWFSGLSGRCWWPVGPWCHCSSPGSTPPWTLAP